MTNTETVKAVYEAFGRGDVPAMLSRLADDVRWRNDGVVAREVPWNGNFSGKANVPGFFKAVYEHLDFRKFEPRVFVEQGNHVVAVLRLESTVQRTGRPLENDVVHLWTFDDAGKISGYQHFNDTAMELQAWGGA